MRTSAAIAIESKRPGETSPWAEALRFAVERLQSERGIPADVASPYLEEVATRFAAVVAQWRKPR